MDFPLRIVESGSDTSIRLIIYSIISMHKQQNLNNFVKGAPINAICLIKSSNKSMYILRIWFQVLRFQTRQKFSR